MSNLKQLRENFQSKSFDERKDYINSLNKDELSFLYKHPDLFLFDKQIIPDSIDWRYLLLQCGRGYGKSYAGSAWLAKKIRNGAKLTALCGPTYFDVQETQMPSLLSWFLPSELAPTPYNSKDHIINFANGSRVLCFSSEKDNVGTNLEYLWCDEIGNWCDSISDKIDLRFENLARAVRKGTNPQIVITSTPKSHKFFWDFQNKIDNNSPFYKVIRGTMFDNPYLPQSFINAELDRVKDSPNRARQEVYGELITENPEALFKMEWIDQSRLCHPNNPNKDHELDIKHFFSKALPQRGINPSINLKRLVISVDPSGSNKKTSDETGIMLLAQDHANEIYVLYDLSDRHTPDAWAKIVRNLFAQYSKLAPTTIVAETNFGGDIVISNICAADHTLRKHIKEIKAFKSKLIRAEPSAAKYQRQKIHHIGYFTKLERQMTNYVGHSSDYSPDRMDALVHGINELIIIPQYTNRDLSLFDSY